MRRPAHGTARCAGLLLLAGLWLAAPPRRADAQLISPGKLTRAHERLEGIRNCTSCHVLGERGAADSKCLSCHTPLATRIRARRGFHATVTDRNCASCHKEHFGRDFDPIRFDAERFDHRKAGFALAGSHARLACDACHTPALVTAADVKAYAARHGASLSGSYLGLGTNCLSCHAADDPHEGQFPRRECRDCHTEERWEGAGRFDHDRARFRLAGLHRQVTCEGCHRTARDARQEPFVRYTGLDFATCASCHEDPHRGAMGAACASCHSPAGWRQINRARFEGRFDHDRTGFALAGRHALLDCASCHAKPARRDAEIAITFRPGTGDAAYPHPVAERCDSCHRDYHDGAFAESPGGVACESCHGQDGWLPSTYDLERHNREAGFELTGAHVATPCADCHRSPGPERGHLTFRFETTRCQSCHAVDNPHGEQFAEAGGETACADCHATEAWTAISRFDHDRTGFPLTGRHLLATCASCHTRPDSAAGAPVRLYRGVSTACASCHAGDDPHRGQFPDVSCGTCHDAQSFHVTAFDHERTRFPLQGAHREVACASCHRTERAPDGTPFTRFRPLGTECKDCHAGSP